MKDEVKGVDPHLMYTFRGFRLDPGGRLLVSAEGQPITLTSRVFDTLLYFVENRGELLDKDTLMRAVWPDTVVEENSLNQAISALRKALGEKPGEHRFILTEPGRGYRFVAEVQTLTQESVPDNEQLDSIQSPSRRRGFPVLIGVLMLVLVLASGYFYFDHRSALPLQHKAVPETSPPVTDEKVVIVTAPQSIAVLPFVDMSPNQDQEYFADGVAEEMLNQLSRIRDLFVIGRESSFAFKGKNEDLRVIGEKLGVSYLLEGSVRKEGKRVRITAQLVKVKDGHNLWSRSYDRDLEDIFAIQDDIAKSVADTLQITLGVGELGRLPGMTSNVAAYDEALLARAADPYSPEGVRTAIEHLERAVELDPDCGLIWLDLSTYYSRAGNIGIQGGREKAEQALERARELTPDSPFVLHRMVTRSIAKGEWLEADRLRQESITAADAYSLQSYITAYNASFLHYVGRSKEAKNYYEWIRASDPLSIDNAAWLTEIYAYTGNFKASLMEADRGMALEGPQLGLRSNALLTALASGDRTEIEKRLALVLEIEGDEHSITAKMRQLLDDPVTAIAELHRLRSRPENQSRLMKLTTSQWAAYFGDPQYALEGLQGIAEEGGNPIVASYSWHPIFHEMRRLEGFKDLMLDIGLAQYWRTSGKWSDFCRSVGEDDFECN